jgi:hypothetical protein
MPCFKKFFNKQQGSFTLQSSEKFSPNLTVSNKDNNYDLKKKKIIWRRGIFVFTFDNEKKNIEILQK